MSRKKKAAKSKKLHTCPGCGKGGFINLKSHRCRALKRTAKKVEVELVAPPESLPEIEKALTPVLERVTRKSEDLLYDMVHAGLFLFKAQVAHRCDTCHTGRDGKFVESEDGGFRAWLQEKYPQISSRTVYRYINGAKNCGLTINDDASAIETLRGTHALQGKTAGDLYRLKDRADGEEEPGDESEPRWTLIRQAATELREQCEAIEKLREMMDAKAFSTICGRLHRTLENMTGQPWGVVPDRPSEPFFREHGDIYEIGT